MKIKKNQFSKSSKSSIIILLELIKYLDNKDKNRLFPITFLLTISGIVESLSIFLLLPFISAISNPKDLLANNFINQLDISNQNTLILFTLIIFLVSLIIGTGVRIFTIYEVNKWVTNIAKNISKKILRILLNEDYEFFIDNNSADYIYTITTDTISASRSIRAVANTLNGLVLFICVMIGLITYKPLLTIILIITTGLAYLAGAKYTKNLIYKSSEMNTIYGRKQLKLLRETFGGIKDTILNRDYDYRIKNYSKNDNYLKKSEVILSTASELPKIVSEAIFLLTVCFLMIFVYLIIRDKNAVLTIGTFLLGSIKILSTMTKVYSEMSIFRSKRFSLLKLLNILRREDKSKFYPINSNQINQKTFNSTITLKNVSFSYKNQKNKKILKNINLNILKNTKIAIIGKTGSGKTTLINIILGLLKPTEGEILIDGNNLNLSENKIKKINWMRNIAYVPQTINLFDTSIIENISLKEKENTDQNMVRICSKVAKLDEFIEKRKDKIDSLIGEDGVRLSGGQRQRLGIARALYKNVDLLILDEATSALDTKTEEEIINNIFLMRKNITILMITHRKNTLKIFDDVISVDNGKLS